MITDKDREDAVSMTRIWMRDSEGNQLDDLAGIIYRIRTESAEQARKEADEKLAIAVKALEEIKQLRKAGPAFESHFSKLQDIGRITNDALKEIQG